MTTARMTTARTTTDRERKERTVSTATSPALASATTERRVVVSDRREESRDVVSLALRPVDGGLLPDWTAGSHVAIDIPDGTVRHYSLCQWPGRRDEYRIAVLRERESTGGSAWLTGEVAVGTVLTIRHAANHFALTPAPEYLFVAGGIGITPLLPMIYAAEAAGTPWRLAYYGSSRADMAFLGELVTFGDRVTVVAKDESTGERVESVLAETSPSSHVYVCGPTRLLDSVRSSLEAAGGVDRLRFELFEAPDAPVIPDDSGSFEIYLSRSKLALTVSADETILDAVRAVGIDILSDCEEGICGSCETSIVSGEAEHRDYVLTEKEKSENYCMMICVSRSDCALLTLAL
jgi:ferredoxin-NADP reductase